jgi:hypothetical protein
MVQCAIGRHKIESIDSLDAPGHDIPEAVLDGRQADLNGLERR